MSNKLDPFKVCSLTSFDNIYTYEIIATIKLHNVFITLKEPPYPIAIHPASPSLTPYPALKPPVCFLVTTD